MGDLAVDEGRGVRQPPSFVCDGCGKEHHPFGSGGAKAEAEKLGAPFLGEVPLDLDIRIGSDGGVPVMVSKPDSPQAQALVRIADQLVASDLYVNAKA